MIFFSGDIQNALAQGRLLKGLQNPNVERGPDGQILEVPQINNSSECNAAKS